MSVDYYHYINYYINHYIMFQLLRCHNSPDFCHDFTAKKNPTNTRIQN